MHNGACLCQNIAWEADPISVPVYHCHCSMCRKMHGAAFATYALTPADHFRWTSSLDTLRNYRSSPMLVRSFCSSCGSVVPNPDEDGNRYFIPIGSQDEGPKVDCHIFFASKASWLEISDNLPKHREFPPGMEQQTFSPTIEKSDKQGGLRGSCLCGRIGFEISAPFKKIYNCHCRRCRRARSAAFTTNGFTPDHALVFNHGRQHLKSYKLPEAKYFTQVFCEICGSSMPRINTARSVAVTPLGTLDDGPVQRPECNIWFASSAHWFAPVNQLPSYPEEPPQ